MRSSITRNCELCGKTFTAFVNNLRGDLVKNGKYCSKACFNEMQKEKSLSVFAKCENCGKEVKRTQSAIRKNKSNRVFCSSSCAATYNNTHKTHGTRRSKLESYLEERLRAEFPDLVLICNSKDAIGSELDFYFPQLRLAIELNGIFHYEPIYGSDKLEQIQADDQQKSLHCVAAGIEFCTIDTSTVTHITSLVKERYWTIIKNLVVPLLGRASSANVQAS